jgi:hypothetical protein
MGEDGVHGPVGQRYGSSVRRARPIPKRVNRMIFYPLAIGLFLLVDTVLRQTGH